jgi:5-formyltetrahydrofolate cyclo-ligase
MNLPDSRIACDAAINASKVAAHKAALRSEMLAARRALTDIERNDAVEKIGFGLADWVAARTIKTLAVYSPIRGEPDLMATWKTMSVWRGNPAQQ